VLCAEVASAEFASKGHVFFFAAVVALNQRLSVRLMWRKLYMIWGNHQPIA
jgi:hypothetical protein